MSSQKNDLPPNNSSDVKWGSQESAIAIVTLKSALKLDSLNVAAYGTLMTENLGIIRLLSNLFLKPHIRFLIVCGEEVEGHFSGETLIFFHQHGYEVMERGVRIKKSRAANPILLLAPEEAEKVLIRFREQIIAISNLIGITDTKLIKQEVTRLNKKTAPPMKTAFKFQLAEDTVKAISSIDVVSCDALVSISPYFQIIPKED